MSKRRRENLPSFEGALKNAALAALEPERYPDIPQPECIDRPGEFVDYGYPLPTAEEAEALCAPCLLLELCNPSARHVRPDWGIQGGIVWVNGRQAHLMAEDDPRLIGDPSEK